MLITRKFPNEEVYLGTYGSDLQGEIDMVQIKDSNEKARGNHYVFGMNCLQLQV